MSNKSVHKQTFSGAPGIFLIAVLLAAFSAAPAVAEKTASGDRYLEEIARLDLADLMRQEVTTVLRRADELFYTPASTYVITRAEIHSSGLRSIAEILRLAPGLFVARTGSSTWNVTARGVEARSLLVLIDGRSVYSPLFGGTFWDVQDILIEDIDRIEVIKGPAGVSWGENAFNGVINIITRHSSRTTGFFAEALGGRFERAAGSVRYGDALGDSGHYRLYARYLDRGAARNLDGTSAQDSWDLGSVGFRTDFDLRKEGLGSHFTFQGDAYKGDAGRPVNLIESFSPPVVVPLDDRVDLQGGNLRGHWQYIPTSRSSYNLQVYYDRTERDRADGSETRNTFDVDLQHNYSLSSRHDLSWGLGWRITEDRIRGTRNIRLEPDSETDQLFNLFVQDEITLFNDGPSLFRIAPGIKVTHNDYTGFEFHPAIRSVWSPGLHYSFWGAVSRAVRSPTRLESDVIINSPPFMGADGIPLVNRIFGRDEYKSETVYAYELGARATPHEKVSVDVSTFYNDYRNLLSLEMGETFLDSEIDGGTYLVIPSFAHNRLKGESYGAEVALNWNFTEQFDLVAAYTHNRLRLSREAGSTDNRVFTLAGQIPENRARLSAYWQLASNVFFNSTLFYTDRLSAFDISSHIRFDSNIRWQINSNWGVQLAGTNLFDRRRHEFGAARVEIPRSLFAVATYRF